MCQKFNTRIQFVPKGAHQSNITENKIKKLNEMVRAYLVEYGDENKQVIWDDCLPYLHIAINSHIHSVTKLSPFQALLGKDYAPLDFIMNTTVAPKFNTFDDETLEHRASINDIVKRNMHLLQDQNKNNIESRFNPVEFKVGDLVKIPTTKQSDKVKYFNAKLYKTFIGPFVIKEFVSDNVVTIQDETVEGSTPMTYHVSKLLKWRTNEAEKARNVPLNYALFIQTE